MSKSFILIKPEGREELCFFSGTVISDPDSMMFTVKSLRWVFDFVLRSPSEEDLRLAPEDVLELGVEFVLFRNGRKVRTPDFELTHVEKLPDDSILQRGLAFG